MGNFRRQPALDGIRAVAVVLVLLFHGGFTWMPAGYVGVSVFFTLSGFLITRLLLTEATATGRIDLRRFYARRVRRLLPASLLCLGAVAVLAAMHRFDDVAGVRRDLLGSLFQVENWVKLFSGRSYADLTNATVGRVAPLEHYWSLAVEEQFYWVWPLLVLALARLVTGPRGRAAVLAGAALVAGIAAPVIAHVWGPDAAYWASPARAGEIMVGCALAGLLAWRPGLPRRMINVLRAVGPLCLAAIVVVAMRWPTSGGPAYAGALPLFALLSAGLILGALVHSPLRKLLGWRPVAAVGAISYGIYLYHWPVFALITGSGTGLPRLPLFGLRVAVTLTLAIASYHFVEQPVRRRGERPAVRSSPRPLIAGLLTTMAVAAAVVVIVPQRTDRVVIRHVAAQMDASATTPPPLVVVPAALSARLPPPAGTALAAETATTAPPEMTAPSGTTATEPGTPAGPDPAVVPDTPAAGPDTSLVPDTTTTGTDATAVPAPTVATDAGATDATGTDATVTTAGPGPTSVPDTTAAPDTTAPPLPALSRPLRVMIIGDSTAEATGAGLAAWADEHPQTARVAVVATAGCGLLRTGKVPTDGSIPWASTCAQLLDHTLPRQIAALHPDTVVVMVTMRDVEDRVWSKREGLISPLDPRFRGREEHDYEAMADTLIGKGVAHVVFIRQPIPDLPWEGDALKMANPARYDAQYQVMLDVAGAHPGAVEVLDLRTWFDALPDAGTLRPDGLHFSPEAAESVSERFLGPQIVALTVDATTTPEGQP